jgi:ketosteroid isomerase-like protein
MRHTTLGAVALAFTAAAASAQTPNAQVMAPINKFIDTFNKGDLAGAASTHAAGADLSIIDELAPYLWRGPQAFQTWSADLDSDAKKRGITEPMVAISAPLRVETGGDQAYVVVPAVYTYKQGGAAMRETAQWTFALKKGAGGWLIHGWTWSGRKPMAAPD